ncbi:unnamed protein product [Spirodela intermedia]|uniref:Uncharacterized protein n=1 Tax=Spirodela intermedia TaxID=51605 RepID=A0A7I8K8U9_SPIIN|nr:unnamed protein product [Spirodela intermedia]
MASAGGGGGKDEGSAKAAAAAVADHITQAVKSTSNLIHLMQENSPSQARLAKLTKNLLVKTATIKNTGQVLEQLPRVISSLDAYMDSGLQSSPHLDTVGQLLSNMESSRIRSAFGDQRSKEVIIPVLTIFQKMFMYKLIFKLKKTSIFLSSLMFHYYIIILL